MTGERASGLGAWLARPLQHLRLRHKLAISLSIAALLPVAVAAWVAVSIVLRSLDTGLREQTDRQLSVGLNLVLRNVESLGQDAVRLASSSELAQALEGDLEQVADVLARDAPHLPSSQVQVADASGALVAERIVGDPSRFVGVRVPANAPLVRDGLGYHRRVTIGRVDDGLVVRAVAPVVDNAYVLRGVVVVSTPLDGEFADGIKGALGTNVLIFAGVAPARSTFLDQFGARYEGIRIPPPLAESVLAGRTVLSREEILGREYAVGYTPVKNNAGDVIGAFGVAVDRGPVLEARAAAVRSLGLGAAGAFVFALGLAGLLSRRLTGPIARLHRGAVAVARGDLDQNIAVDEGDEIGDLAVAFTHMTEALKENQQRLAARMRELVALHDAGRAVSSVLSQDQLLRKIVDAVSRVLDVRLCTLWLVDGRGGRAVTGRGAPLRIGAGRGQSPQSRRAITGEELAQLARPLETIAREVSVARATLRVDRVSDDPKRRDAAVAAGVTGSLVATPLERKGQVVGVIVIGRTSDARPFSEADSNLLATFADQAATAIENARLYEEVRAFNEELEEKVRERTAQLQSINDELGRAIRELRDTQAQLILSERLAGLGQLVAGVAHEINSPSAAIRGTVDSVADNVRRLAEASAALAALPVAPQARGVFLARVAAEAPALVGRPMASPAEVRRRARGLRSELLARGVAEPVAHAASRALAEHGADALASAMTPLLLAGDGTEASAVDYLKAYMYLHRSSGTIQQAIRRIQRIVGALKSYSHLDQEAGRVHSDLHEGIETTLVMLDHELGHGISVERNYGKLNKVPIYVDELNQVWTNLLHNAIQALDGEGTVTIETEQRDGAAVVRIIDDGRGIPLEVMPRIFEPFYTTKPKGEGTGLGLGIVRKIVDKHGGSVTASSQPRRTCFEVWLPLKPVEREPSTSSSGVDAPDLSADDRSHAGERAASQGAGGSPEDARE